MHVRCRHVRTILQTWLRYQNLTHSLTHMLQPKFVIFLAWLHAFGINPATAATLRCWCSHTHTDTLQSGSTLGIYASTQTQTRTLSEPPSASSSHTLPLEDTNTHSHISPPAMRQTGLICTYDTCTVRLCVGGCACHCMRCVCAVCAQHPYILHTHTYQHAFHVSIQRISRTNCK